MRADRTRYQILYTHSDRLENFTAQQKTTFQRRLQALRNQGIAVTTWDTKRNPLSKLLSF